MPFGQNIAPQTFKRWMDKIFKHLKDFCVVYIDNIFVFSKTIEEQKKHLKIIWENSRKMEYSSPKKIEVERNL